MANQDAIKRLSQVWDAHSRGVLAVNRVRIEELCLVLDRLRDRDSLINVELRAALDAEVAKLERID